MDDRIGRFTPDTFLAFVLTGIAGTFIYTWIFNHTRASRLIAMLVHASGNAAATFLARLIPTVTPISDWVQALGGAWLNAIAFGVAAVALVMPKPHKTIHRVYNSVSRAEVGKISCGWRKESHA